MIARTVVVIATALRPRKHGSVGQQAGLYTMRIAPRHVLRGQHPSGEATRDMPGTLIAMAMVSAVSSFRTRAGWST
ncbi:hypothetical protein A3718_01410 [Erythrobacter sp. HI0019]|jgi:hypothetical protein|nr:hypothetical protein A3718_01410 [Erythrobacter sp. HI0019]KZY09193.1 hypothetical protein A3723_10665 [Erythrobacter sp. HI0028]